MKGWLVLYKSNCMPSASANFRSFVASSLLKCCCFCVSKLVSACPLRNTWTFLSWFVWPAGPSPKMIYCSSSLIFFIKIVAIKDKEFFGENCKIRAFPFPTIKQRCAYRKLTLYHVWTRVRTFLLSGYVLGLCRRKIPPAPQKRQNQFAVASWFCRFIDPADL